jgi:hypothetical protein
MIANSVANFSQFERRLIGQRTKDALAVKRAQGVQLGRPRVMPDKVVRKIERMRGMGRVDPGHHRGIERRGSADGPWGSAVAREHGAEGARGTDLIRRTVSNSSYVAC